MSKSDQLLELFGGPVIDDYFGQTISYQRGTVITPNLTATWDDKTYQFVGTDGLETAVQTRDYTIKKTLIPGITPRHGDFVIDGSEKFQVLPVADRPAVEELAGGYRWLVHTVRVN